VPSRSLTMQQVLIRLAETPTRIAALTTGLLPAELLATPGPDEWSANDVLAHLRACSDVWGGHIAAILSEDMPTRRGVNPRTWIEKTDYLELEFQPSFRSFAAQRAGLLAALEPLPHEDWSRTATVMGWGIGHDRTAMSYAEQLARHERPHIQQIERIVKTIHA
jgi:DinB superfamily